MDQRLAVTLLYVPADRPDRVAKALGSDADVVIVDLEDAVVPAAKDQAREGLPALLAGAAERRVQVRVNALGTPWCDADLTVVSELDEGVEVRVPKVERPADVERFAGRLGAARRLHCLIETAVGVENAYAIASASDAVASIGLGEQDLRSALGVTDDHGLDWARGRIVNAASAAGLAPPVQGVYTAVRDLDGLRRSCLQGRGRGFVGRCAIHPTQLSVIRSAYRPDDEEIARARELLDALDADSSTGGGVAMLSDGSFVDPAMVQGARRVLALEALTR